MGGLGRQLVEQLGAIAHSGPAAQVQGWISPYGAPGKAAHLVVLLALLNAVALAIWPRDELRARDLWVAIGVGVGLHLAFMAWIVGDFPRSWHWMVEAAAGALAMAALLERTMRLVLVTLARRSGGQRVAAFSSGIVTIVVLAVAAMSLVRVVNGDSGAHKALNDQAKIGRYWNARLPAGTRVGAWNAGYLAYFSDLQVVNLDGLVNAPGYRERVERDGLVRYLCEEEIPYVIDTWEDPSYQVVRAQAIGLGRKQIGPSQSGLLHIPASACEAALGANG